MFKKILLAAFITLITSPVFAAEGLIWSLDIYGATAQTNPEKQGIVEIAEVKLLDEDDVNVTNLTNTYAHTQSVGATSWTVTHNQGLQDVDVTVVSVPADTPYDITIVDEDSLTIDFGIVSTTGTAAVVGSTFDFPSANRPGTAVPEIQFFENRPAAAAFDGLAASYFKSTTTPSATRPLTLQYSYWIGTADNLPDVKSYSITVISRATSPTTWRLRYYKDGAWHLADQQAGIYFADGETRTFEIE